MNHDQQSKTPLSIPVKGWMDIAKRVWNGLSDLQVGLLAAAVAFYGLLSMFPAVFALVAITGIFVPSSVLVEQSNWLLSALPTDAADMILAQVKDVAGSEGGPVGFAAIAAIALALWSASKGVASLIGGLNIIYGESEERGFIKLKAVTLALTFALIGGIGATIALVAAIPAALSLFGASQQIIDIAMVTRWPLLFFVGALGIASLYRHGPSRRTKQWGWLSIGALLSCALWVAGTVGFSFYVQAFGTYNETFGAIGGVIVMLTWLWLSAYVVLLGAQIDAEVEAQAANDSTVGPDRPIGTRGATKADSVGGTHYDADQNNSEDLSDDRNY